MEIIWRCTLSHLCVNALGKRGLGIIILNNYRGMVKQEEWRILFILKSSYLPSLFRFVSTKILTAAVSYVLLDNLTSEHPYAPDRDHPTISAANESIFPALASPYLFRSRIVITACLWFSNYLMLHLFHDILCLLFVAATILKIKIFSDDAIHLYITLPPLFGSPSLALTIRRFWSRFWHQCLCSSLNSTANNIINNLISPSPAPTASSFARRVRKQCVLNTGIGALDLLEWHKRNNNSDRCGPKLWHYGSNVNCLEACPIFASMCIQSDTCVIVSQNSSIMWSKTIQSPSWDMVEVELNRTGPFSINDNEP